MENKEHATGNGANEDYNQTRDGKDVDPQP